MSALLFLDGQVLQQPFDWLEDVQRAKKPSKSTVTAADALKLYQLSKASIIVLRGKLANY